MNSICEIARKDVNHHASHLPHPLQEQGLRHRCRNAGDPMSEDEALRLFGPPPAHGRLDEIRFTLEQEAAREAASQGAGDTQTMRFLCVQLFVSGTLPDCVLIWRAKSASMDADASIEIELLCGRGLEVTQKFLQDLGDDPRTVRAAERLASCEASGDFEGFDVAARVTEYIRYYRGD